MQYLFWLCAAVSPLVVCGCGVDGARVNDNEGFRPLFNGKDLSGWTVKAKPEDMEKGFWTVEDGVITADSMERPEHDYVWLVTDREYADFVLRMQFRAFRQAQGNSGVQFRSRYDDEAFWLDGPQVDIHPAEPWRTGMIWDETRGIQRWLCPDVSKGQWVKPEMASTHLVFYYAEEGAGWNDLEITAAGTRCRVVLNGVEVTDYDGAGVLDDAIHRKREVGLKGCIALQIHRNDAVRVQFRDLAVREVKK